jgi:tRNA 2-thiouridine synthesizing protein A
MLEAVCTDPGALNDIPEWCRISGYRVIDARPGADEQVIIVEVSR